MLRLLTEHEKKGATGHALRRGYDASECDYLEEGNLLTWRVKASSSLEAVVSNATGVTAERLQLQRLDTQNTLC